MYEGTKWARTWKFGVPWPPMNATIILEPVHVDKNAQCEIYVQLQSGINKYLQELGTDGKDNIYTTFKRVTYYSWAIHFSFTQYLKETQTVPQSECERYFH